MKKKKIIKTLLSKKGCLPFQQRRNSILFRVLFQQTNKQIKLRMEPQDARVGGSAAVREGASAPVTSTQHDTMFGAKDATAVVEENVD